MSALFEATITAFVCRMLEDAGIAFFFEQADPETRLVLTDGPQAGAPRPSIPFRDDATLSVGREYVTQLRVGQRVRRGTCGRLQPIGLEREARAQDRSAHRRSVACREHAAPRGREPEPQLLLEPPSRLELETYGLRNRCSTTELRWLNWLKRPGILVPLGRLRQKRGPSYHAAATNASDFAGHSGEGVEARAGADSCSLGRCPSRWPTIPSEGAAWRAPRSTRC